MASRVAWLLAPLLATAPAVALEPEDLLKGRVIFSHRELPLSFRSARAYVKKLKRLHRQRFDVWAPDGQLRLYYAAFFARPVPDVQVDVTLFDVTDGKRERKLGWENFLPRRGERSVYSNVTLSRDEIAGNRRYEVVVSFRRRVIATGTLTLRARVEAAKPQEQDFTRKD